MLNTSSNIAVLISGNGSNLQAIIDNIQAGNIKAKICVVISNKADAYGLERAKQAGIPTVVLPGQDYTDRDSYDRALLEQLQAHNANWVVLAGFMRILGPELVKTYENRMLNIHPSLLPKYPGLNTHQQALDNKDKVHGCTVHYVTEDLDAGPVIAQKQCEILENDTAKSLQQRVHKLEHVLYPHVISKLVHS